MDLHLDVSGSRVRAGLEAALRDAVQAGRLAAGTRLPSSRTLAADLGIARNTVADAYNQLVAEGWLTARQGSGTRVAGIAAELVNAASSRALGYGDSRGRPELRSALAGYLARARGVRVTPDRIVICTGFTQALALLCQVLRERGARAMAVEAYSRQEYADILTSHGLTPAALPVDDSGAVLDPLPDAQAVLLTPAHQFPLGPALSAQRRARAAQWAAATGGLVIEDDYDGEFRYDRQPVGALQALAPEHIAYAGSASKTLVPGLTRSLNCHAARPRSRSSPALPPGAWPSKASGPMR